MASPFPPSPTRPSAPWSRRVVTAGVGVTTLVGGSALLGWAANAELLLTWGATPTIKVGGALALLLLAAAVLLLARPGARGRRPASVACGVIIFWSTAALVEWCIGRSMFEPLIVEETTRSGMPGRNSPHAAIAFAALAGTLLTLDATGRRAVRLHVALIGASLAAVVLAAAGWLYGAPSLTGAGSVAGIALPTLAGLVALLIAIGALRPQRPPLSWAGGDAAVAAVLRRLLPAAVIVPIALGGIRLAGEHAGFYSPRFGVALFTTTMVVVLVALVLWTAKTVEVRDRDRRELEVRLQAIFDHMPGALYLKDLGGRFQTANRACAEAMGVTVPELIGHTVEEAMGADRAREVAEQEHAVIERGEVVAYETTVTTPDGSEHHHFITKYPVTGEHGELIGIGGVGVDITERKRAERALADAEARMRQLLDAAPDAVVIVGEDGIIQTINAQTERLFGYAPDELVGSPVELLIPARLRAHHGHHRASFTAAPTSRSMGAGLTLRAVRKDGTEVPVEISLSPLPTAEGLLTSAAIRDVTERSRNEAEQAALRRVATAVAQDAGAAEIFQLVAEEIARVLEVDNGSVVRFESAEAGSILGWWTAGAPIAAQEHLALDDGSVMSVVARTGRAARMDSSPSPAADGATPMAVSRLRSSVAAPIRVAGRLWGAAGAATTTDTPLAADAEERIERFTALVATAISNAQAWETLARQAATDAMTGLMNYRTFHERLREETARAQRHGRPLSVVLFDLDHFKAVNDTHGHHTGDRVLAEAGRRLADQARTSEIVARVGGEEFAWLLPETDAMGAFAAAERARRAIEATPFEGVGIVTASAGVCSVEDSGDPDLLMRMADRALYWAKDHGRNTTFRYTHEARAQLADHPHQVERYQSMSSIRALARAIDAKDFSTRSHSERVAALAERLALRLGWTSKRARALHSAALLHDVGKIGIPDTILLKPGPLTETEFAEVRRHPVVGARIVAEVLEEEPCRWVRHHHERWDGGGYPDGLRGHDIPDGAQLLALADAWDVMTTDRTYKATRTVEDALAECAAQRGRQFAPDVVDALFALSRDDLDVADAR